MFMGIIAFLRKLSRRVYLFFSRQNIYLVKESQFEELLNEIIDDDVEIRCQGCQNLIGKEDIQGWYYNENNELCFFCGNLNCALIENKEG